MATPRPFSPSNWEGNQEAQPAPGGGIFLAPVVSAVPMKNSTDQLIDPYREDGAAMYEEDLGTNYAHISTLETLTVKGTPGILHSIVVNNAGSAFVITVYDNTAAAAPEVAVISVAAATTLKYNLAFTTGLTVVTSGTTAGDITIVYS